MTAGAMHLDDRRLAAALEPLPAAWDRREGLRPAAVLAPVLRIGGADHVLFTRRRAELPHHPGQVSFPGGARCGGEDPLTCALRETAEELGVPPLAVTVLGGLPPRHSIAGFWVVVVVGRLAPGIPLVPDPREVARVIAVPVAALLRREAWTEEEVPGVRRPVPHFRYGGEVVWGLTGRFTLDLLERVRGSC